MRGTSGEARINIFAMISDSLLYMDMPVLADQQELTYNRFVWKKDVVWKTCLSDGWERESVREIRDSSVT